MKILHLVSGLNTGGIERWLLGILPHIDSEKYKIDFLSRLPVESDLDQKFREQGSNVYLNSGSRFNFINYSNQIKKLVKEGGYDIIHNHLAHHGGIPSRVYKSLDIPSVVSFHNAKLGPLQFGNPIKRLFSSIYVKKGLSTMVKNGDIITGCSKDVLTEIGKVVSFKNSKTVVLHYGVSIPKVVSKNEKKDFKKSLGINGDKKIIVHVGSFTHQKNHFFLLDIAKKVFENRSDCLLVLVGEGDLKPDVEKYANKLGITNSIKFLGLRSDVEQIFLVSDIFLFPSLFEGLPVACLEALASGLPAVGSNVPGIKLLVKNNSTGFLCEKNDISSFVNKVNLLLDDEDLRNKIGNESREFIRNNFSYSGSANHLLKLYNEVLKKNNTTE